MGYLLLHCNPGGNLTLFLNCLIVKRGESPLSFCVHCTWAEFTWESCCASSKVKVTDIRNPCIYYLQWIVSHVVFGCGDSDGIVCYRELMFLWAILEKIHLDISSYLVRYLAKVYRAPTRNILIGGLITPIAMALGCDLIGM